QAHKVHANAQGKVLHYRTSVILRSAVLEAGNLFCLMLALLERNMNHLLFFALGLLVFFYFRPRINEITDLYQLTSGERQELTQALKKK
ncbi:MAG: hypothetical protein KDC54_15175, partial [Lewinella sp.]|nr:hypothetical protein [Lewinella sp.]